MSIFLNDQLVEPTIFPDGTSQVWKLENISDETNKILFVWEKSESEIFHLLQLIDLLTASSNAPIEINMPYLPYARQDKCVKNDRCFALNSLSFCFNNCFNIKKISACDPHPPMSFDDFGVESYYPSKLKQFINERYDVVIYPDEGSNERYRTMFLDHTSYVCDKERDQSTGRILSLDIPEMNLTGKRVCVLDDLCDGGGTFVWLADEIYKRGYSDTAKFDLVVTHGLFSKGTRLLLDRFDRVITTDSLYRPEVFDIEVAAKQCPEYKQMKKFMDEGRLIMVSSEV